MHCEHFHDPATGVTAIICGNHRQPRCACGARSGFQCDWKLGNGKTCDRHICKGCAQQVGPDKHLCPEHQQAYRTWLAK